VAAVTLPAALLIVGAATAALTLLGVALTVYLDGRDARRDARRRNMAHRR
jgi:hypothetical protein